MHKIGYFGGGICPTALLIFYVLRGGLCFRCSVFNSQAVHTQHTQVFTFYVLRFPTLPSWGLVIFFRSILCFFFFSSFFSPSLPNNPTPPSPLPPPPLHARGNIPFRCAHPLPPSLPPFFSRGGQAQRGLGSSCNFFFLIS